MAPFKKSHGFKSFNLKMVDFPWPTLAPQLLNYPGPLGDRAALLSLPSPQKGPMHRTGSAVPSLRSHGKP